MRNQRSQRCRRGITLVELMAAMTLMVIVVLVVGILLVSGHKNWNSLFGRVYRQEAIDAFAARSIFDNVCRKASSSKAVLGGGNDTLQLYYWNTGSTASTPENYAKFSLSGENLIVEQGKTQPGTWTPDPGSPVETTHVAALVKSVKFNVQGSSVQMLLEYADTSLVPVICSAIRQND